MSTAMQNSPTDLAGYDDIGLESSVVPDGKELPAWAISLGLHVVVLFLFWTMRLAVTGDPALDIVSQVEEIDPNQQIVVAASIDKMGSNADNNQPTQSKASALLVGRDPQKPIDKQLEETVLDRPRPDVEPIIQPSRDQFVATVQTTGATQDVGGTDGAMDILTDRIEKSLHERKTHVVWLFDASQSLNERRKAIADRFQNVYKQLNIRNNNIDKVLTTSVVSFGEKTTFLTEESVVDVADVVKGIQRIDPDKSGKEFVFTAIGDVLQKWRPKFHSYRNSVASRRNVMFVIVTDERGDDYAGKSGKDYSSLDQAIRDLRRLNIRVYCVGNASLFGREKGFVSFTDETGYQWTNLEVDQGPETVAPERLQLPFWGNVSGRVDRLSASAGPYALTRMCHETGGEFFIAEHSMGAIRFPQDVMRRYQPFYGTIPVYLKDVHANGAKSALHLLAQATLREPIPQPQLIFGANNEAILRTQIGIAQRPMARLNYQLQEMAAVLENTEKAREKISEDRWRAGYDLAMGRLLATQARAIGYQATLAEMASSPLPFKTKGSNQWRLVPSSNWQNAPPQVKKIIKKADLYLKRVIDEHPHTPWALLAEHELATEMGWEWKEGTMPVSSMRNGSNPNRILLADENDPTRPKTKKPPRPKEKPKL